MATRWSGSIKNWAFQPPGQGFQALLKYLCGHLRRDARVERKQGLFLLPLYIRIQIG